MAYAMRRLCDAAQPALLNYSRLHKSVGAVPNPVSAWLGWACWLDDDITGPVCWHYQAEKQGQRGGPIPVKGAVYALFHSDAALGAKLSVLG